MIPLRLIEVIKFNRGYITILKLRGPKSGLPFSIIAGSLFKSNE